METFFIKNVELTLNGSPIDQIEDLHYCEHIEDVCHLARGALIFGVLAPKRGSVPVAHSSRIDKGRVTTVSQLYVGLRIEVFSCENDNINDDDLIDTHQEEVLNHFSRDDVLIFRIGRPVEEFKSRGLSS